MHTSKLKYNTIASNIAPLPKELKQFLCIKINSRKKKEEKEMKKNK